MNGGEAKKRYLSAVRIQMSGPPVSTDRGSDGGRSQRKGSTQTSISTVLSSSKAKTVPVDNGYTHPERLAPPLFTKPLQDCNVDEGNDITLSGLVSGSQPIRVSWLHNGKVVRFGSASFVGGEARLVVKECLPEDTGAYTCVAENTAGKTFSSAAVYVRDYETIIAQRKQNTKTPLASPPLSNPPVFNHTVENRGPNSPPTPSQEDTSVFRGPQSPTSAQSGASPNGSPGDRKEVVLKRRLSSGTAPPLFFLSPPNQLEARAGEPVRLTCEFRGSAPVVSCWIRNKKEVLEDSRCRIEAEEESSSLVISEARPADSGRYTIVVRDRKSSAQHTLTLSVVDRPEPPSSCPVASLLSPSSLVLSWSGPSYDGGSAITGYVVEVEQLGPDKPATWSELTSQCKSTCLKVSSGLQPQASYRFRIRACNAVGVSEPSQESQPIRMSASGETHDEAKQEFVDVTIDTTHKITDHYNVLEKLGVGKFGQVFRLTHKETGRVCAGKFYKGRRLKEREAAKKEIELMNSLHHPKLVQCLGAYDNKPEIVMVMEFIAGGELFERIVDDNFEHTEPTSVGYMQQILEGIQYMHQKNIVHLDLKPENIVCVDHTGTQIKIIDFGLASTLDPSNPLKVMHGTPEFVAPEVINYDTVGLATDIWSIGVICYILLSGESPFQGDSDTETLALVTAAKWEFDEESFEEITAQAKDFISSVLIKDARRRLTCEQALAHPWMAAFVSADPSTTKNLSKDKMKKFLARQKWKKTGKALLALKRMALLSKPEGSISQSSSVEDTEQALQNLELKLQSKPQFTSTPTDQTVKQGSDVHIACLITGYPDPEVMWLKDGEAVEERPPRVQVDYEDGRCALTLEGVTVEDRGVYSCKASNDHGEELCSATLTVLESNT
ncbi:myosin light chain kinase, smooth muscle [Chanos chanos]|uniref:Myosin light chain kinase, smooth muscle n=1 Tax=Chanos chanos TaxID=29144 RepID=A0A6J2WZZ7_CHACN|nr:myosin light chain kinase, smooth muscle-like [Chanos chanos]